MSRRSLDLTSAAQRAFEVAERGQQIVPCRRVSSGTPTFSSAETETGRAPTETVPTETVPAENGLPEQAPGEQWLAIHAGVGPAALLVSWTVPGARAGHDARAVPSAYSIETSANSTNGRDGDWRREASIEGNRAPARAHVIEFDGQSWVRLVFCANGDGSLPAAPVAAPVAAPATGIAPPALRVDLHDASDGTDDCWLLLGDSTLASGSSGEAGEASWADAIHDAYPGYFPALVGAGSPGASPASTLAHLDELLQTHPAARRVAIAYSAASHPAAGASARENPGAASPAPTPLAAIVAAVIASGSLPVLAQQPAIPGRSRDAVDELNREIAALQKQHALPPGPDLAAWFDANPHQLDGDGRPDPEGRQAIRRLWEEALDVFYVPQ